MLSYLILSDIYEVSVSKLMLLLSEIEAQGGPNLPCMQSGGSDTHVQCFNARKGVLDGERVSYATRKSMGGMLLTRKIRTRVRNQKCLEENQDTRMVKV